MKTIDDNIQPTDDFWEQGFSAHLPHGQAPWASLLERKRKEGRYYFHPDPRLSIFVKNPRDFGSWIDVQGHTGTRFPPYVVGSDKKATALSPVRTLATQSPDLDVPRLEQKIRFLEAQLESQQPYLQLYRLGAAGLLVAVISLVAWKLTGIGIPFRPLFAVSAIPASIGLIVMAFLVRPESEMLLPFMREIFKTLRSESGKAQPAIRIELCLHGLYAAILVFCLGAALLHALMPWVREGAEHLFEMGFITSLVVSCALAVVSVTLSLRLK